MVGIEGMMVEGMVGMSVRACRSRTVMLFVTTFGFEAAEEIMRPIFAGGMCWWWLAGRFFAALALFFNNSGRR